MRAWHAAHAHQTRGPFRIDTHDESQGLCCVHGRREDLGPQALVRGGYGATTEYGVRLITPVFEIEGTMEIPGRFDFTSLMTEGTREFIPIFNATLTAILLPQSARGKAPA